MPVDVVADTVIEAPIAKVASCAADPSKPRGRAGFAVSTANRIRAHPA